MAAGLFAFYIAPEIDIELDGRSLAIGFSTLLTPLIFVFSLCCVIAFAIVGWRLWLLHINPGRRQRTDAEL